MNPTPNSSYLEYLPPILWVPASDPDQFLGKHLRIFERILTGFPIQGTVIRASAPFTLAQNDSINLTNPADVVLFQVGDWVTIEGTIERRQVHHFIGSTIVLDANLLAIYPPGVVRIANLVAGQTSFRVSNAARLERGAPLRILQAGQTEDLLIGDVQDAFITLVVGLSGNYHMGTSSVPVKLLDTVTVNHNGHAHDDVETTINNLVRAFQPFQTRTDFLPWLASWVALGLRSDWSEFQQRKLISQMSQIYQLRGLKEGICTYLDIYAVTAAKPRMVVDDNEAVFRAVFAEDGSAVLRAVAHSNTVSPVSSPNHTVTALLHPSGIGVDSKNTYFVCDFGHEENLAVPRRAALWALSANGDIDYSPPSPASPTQPAKPWPMPKAVFQGLPLFQPSAVTVEEVTDNCSVLEIGQWNPANPQRAGIYRFAPPAYALTKVIAWNSVPAFPATHPVDMVLDAMGHFIVLDRGEHPRGSTASPPTVSAQIVEVSEGPLAVAVHPLASLEEPTAIIRDNANKYIVADARDQMSVKPAELFRVDPAAGWAQTPLLAAVPAGENPLVFPTGLAWESNNMLLVCDTGLRLGFAPGGTQDSRVMAEQPHLYRVNLGQVPPFISRVTRQRQLVCPTKMAFDRRRQLLITDQGNTLTGLHERDWRAGSDEFGLTVFFSDQRPTTNSERNRFRRGIMQVIDSEKPGHTAWWMAF